MPRDVDDQEAGMSGAKPNGNGIETQKERLNSLGKDVERLTKNQDDIFAKYEGIGRTNWTIVLSAIGVATVICGGLWGLSMSPVGEAIRDLKTERPRIDATYVRKDVFDARLAEMGAKLAHAQADSNAAVPRVEYTERQRGVEQQMVNMIARTEEIRRDLSAIFPTTKVMDELLKRIDRLERERLNELSGRDGRAAR